MELVKPSVVYKEQYLASLDECDDIKETRHELDSIALARRDFEEFVVFVLGQEEGKFLKPGWVSSGRDPSARPEPDEARHGEKIFQQKNTFVPASTFWLVDDGVFIGSLTLRHVLNDHLRNIGGHIGYNIRPTQRNKGYGKLILKLGLEKARELGLEKVLLTCDVTNEGSRKIIESNGGVADTSYSPGGEFPVKLRYWIPL